MKQKLFSIFCCLLLSASMVMGQNNGGSVSLPSDLSYLELAQNGASNNQYRIRIASSSWGCVFKYETMTVNSSKPRSINGTWTLSRSSNYMDDDTNYMISSGGNDRYNPNGTITFAWKRVDASSGWPVYDVTFNITCYVYANAWYYQKLTGTKELIVRSYNSTTIASGNIVDLTDYYKLTVVSGNASQGSVSGDGSASGGQYYAAGSSHTNLRATPSNASFIFSKWQKNGSDFSGNTSNPLSITLNNNDTYTAVFIPAAAPQYNITVQTATPDYCTVSGGGTYYEGEEITISSASKNEHLYIFDAFMLEGEDEDMTEPSFNITVTGNATYTAYYRLAKSGTITAATNNASYGTASASLTGSQPGGTAVTLTATPYGGYAFVGWDDNNDGTVDNTDNPRTVYVDGDKEYVANFIVETASYASFSFDNPNDNIQIDEYTEPAAQCQTSFYPYGISLVEIIAKNTTRTSKNYLQMYIKTNNFRTYYPEGGSSYQGPAYGTYSVSVPSEYGPVIGNCDNSIYESNYYFVYTGDVTDVVIGYKVETASHGGTCHYQGYEGTLAQRLCIFSSYGADYSNETRSNFTSFNNGTITVAEGAGGNPYITIRIGGTLAASIGAPAQPYNLAWDANGGELSGSYTAAGSVNEGASITAPTATRTGYTFTGWSPAFTGTMPSANTTYTAQWTANTYTVHFDGNGNTGGTMSNQSHTYGASKALTTNAFTRTGHTFKGWATSADRANAGTVDYTDGQSVSNLTTTNNGTYNLYAVWEINTYTVTVNKNENGYGTLTGESSNTVTVENVPYGTNITTGTGENANKVTINGTTVTATPAASDAQYSYAFNNWTNGAATVTGNMTVTANFTRTTNTYDITWKSEDGTSTLETDEAQAYGTATAYNGATTPTKTVTGYTYTFDGWATSANGEKAYNNGETPTVSGAATYYAHFTGERDNYTITYNGLEGATNTNPTSYNVETETITLANPGTRDGYIFAGWKDESANTITQITTGSTGNRTLTATWNAATTLDLYDTLDASYYNNIKALHGQTYDVTYHRSVAYTSDNGNARWYTLCLPFDVDRSQLENSGLLCKVYEYRYAEGSADVGDQVTFHFRVATSMVAGQGYLVKATGEMGPNFTFKGVTLNTSADTKTDVNDLKGVNAYYDESVGSDIAIVGVLRSGTLSNDDRKVMGLANNKIWYPHTSGNPMPAYRAYFYNPNASPTAMPRVRIVVEGEGETELEVVDGELYDAGNGYNADEDVRGPSGVAKKYIRNGVLIIERNGVRYDAQGKRL